MHLQTMKLRLKIVTATLLSLPWLATAHERFVIKIELPSGQTVVVAEGDGEARSIGGFSVRLYQAAPAPDATTFFTAGLIHARDGTLDKVRLADVDGDQQPDIVVIARSAGTGGYQSAYAFAASKERLSFIAAVQGLRAQADPVAALRLAAAQGPSYSCHEAGDGSIEAMVCDNKDLSAPDRRLAEVYAAA